ncbi:energy transducer TonB [Flaviaesturariibacter amylovorans]
MTSIVAFLRPVLFGFFILAGLDGSAQSGARKKQEPKPAARPQVPTPQAIPVKRATPAPDPEAVPGDAKQGGSTVDPEAKPPAAGNRPAAPGGDPEQVVNEVEVPPAFPGGMEAWANYLRSNLKASVPENNGAPSGTYRVRVQFVVDREGNVSDVKALNDPGYGMAEEAVRVIRRGPRWTPGVQYGRTVKARFTQTIAFGVS